MEERGDPLHTCKNGQDSCPHWYDRLQEESREFYHPKKKTQNQLQ